ncbi:hypothetical protein A6U96_17645 [Agrobacterium tumefaciens]|nr:hypothetical protein A6U96_17645 [Agrobacterium tumefaciens]OCJ57510.1 hypothetical protein A6U94_25295 [Agrobacterium tumefaciens]
MDVQALARAGATRTFDNPAVRRRSGLPCRCKPSGLFRTGGGVGKIKPHAADENEMTLFELRSQRRHVEQGGALIGFIASDPPFPSSAIDSGSVRIHV